MTEELTLSIIKPDAVKRNLTGKINSIFESNNLSIVAQKMILLSKLDAERFYGVHKERANKYMSGGLGALLGFELKGGEEAGKKFIDNLSIIDVLNDAWDPLVSSAEIIESPDVSFNDIGGLSEQIKQIRQAIELPIECSSLFPVCAFI